MAGGNGFHLLCWRCEYFKMLFSVTKTANHEPRFVVISGPNIAESGPNFLKTWVTQMALDFTTFFAEIYAFMCRLILRKQ